MRAIGPFVFNLLEVLGGGASEHCLLDAFPSSLAEEVLVGAGKAKRRVNARLPAPLVLALIQVLAVFRKDTTRGVLERVACAVGAPASWRGKVPVATSISTAMDRLGFEPVRELFRRVCGWLLDQPQDLAEKWRGLRPVGLDGTTFRTPDTSANVDEFGRPGSGRASGGFPQTRCLAVVDILNHFVLAAGWGPCRGPGSGELSVAEASLLSELRTDWLVLMDRGFFSYRWYAALLEREVPFIARIRTGKCAVALKKLRSLKRGCDWAVEFPVPRSLRPRGGLSPLRGLRLVRIRRHGYRPVDLLTNLPSQKFSCAEIAEFYAQRWEVEFAFRELKVGLVEEKVQFRTKTPSRVKQEAYGLLLAYNALRYRMAQAARLAGVEPRRVSFAAALSCVRLVFLLPGLDLAQLLQAIASNVIPQRPRRRYPRVSKVPLSKWAANNTRAKSSRSCCTTAA